MKISFDPSDLSNFVLYDGDCPVCEKSIAWTSVGAAFKEINLVNARSAPELVKWLRASGVEINDTIVVKVGNPFLTKADALVSIAGYVEGGSFASRVIRHLVRKIVAIQCLYPMLAVGRKALLFIIRRKLI